VLTSPTYTLRDVKSFAIGFESAKGALFDQFMAFDARKSGTEFEVPFFLFQGDTDVVTVTSLAEPYFAEIKAPVKQLTHIKGAGHFAAFTQPGQFLTALLTHVRPLSQAASAEPARPAL
jgi:pimeloyl-ACP methyl ester carboxylesterase